MDAPNQNEATQLQDSTELNILKVEEIPVISEGDCDDINTNPSSSSDEKTPISICTTETIQNDPDATKLVNCIEVGHNGVNLSPATEYVSNNDTLFVEARVGICNLEYQEGIISAGCAREPISIRDSEELLSDPDDSKPLAQLKDLLSDHEGSKPEADSEDSALGSLPSETILNEQDVRSSSDGSDSGLGSEITDSQHRQDQIDWTKLSESDHVTIPPRKSNLKRKYEDTEPLIQCKKQKKSLSFEGITVYYFLRSQGFSCIPSQGGSTLGMEKEHSHVQKFTLNEHAQEQRRLHRQVIQQLRSESYRGSSLTSSDDSESDEDPSDISESELDMDSYYFLQPVSTRQRRALLRAAGVRKIEGREKDECRDIRMSRDYCGCSCKGTCKPETCSCSLAGIKCQVDRLNFPCSCSKETCNNTTGRIEFNPMRVRNHFMETLMRLGLEKKKEEKVSPNKWESSGNTSKNCMAICENSQPRYCEIAPKVDDCVSTVTYPSMHCEIQGTVVAPTNGFGYTAPTQILVDNKMYIDNHNMQVHPYTSNFMFGKSLPYQPPAITYNAFYPLSQQHSNDTYDNMLCYSARSFEDFAQPTHISMFNYCNMYNHLPKTSQDHSLAYSSYDMYKSNMQYDCTKQEYNLYPALTYQSENKDQNWFSNSSLTNLDSAADLVQTCEQVEPTQTESEVKNSEGPSESLGELIKNTLVNSVLG